MIFRAGLSPASHCQSPWIPAKAGMTSWRQTFVPHPLSQRACRFSGADQSFSKTAASGLNRRPRTRRRHSGVIDNPSMNSRPGSFSSSRGVIFNLPERLPEARATTRPMIGEYHALLRCCYFPSPSIFRFAVTDEFISRIEACLNHVQQTRGRQALVHQSPDRAAH